MSTNYITGENHKREITAYNAELYIPKLGISINNNHSLHIYIQTEEINTSKEHWVI